MGEQTDIIEKKVQEALEKGSAKKKSGFRELAENNIGATILVAMLGTGGAGTTILTQTDWFGTKATRAHLETLGADLALCKEERQKSEIRFREILNQCTDLSISTRSAAPFPAAAAMAEEVPLPAVSAAPPEEYEWAEEDEGWDE